jgi:hypothetical protein
MTTQPNSATAPETAHPTNVWKDAIFVVGIVVLLTIVDLVVCITVATSH